MKLLLKRMSALVVSHAPRLIAALEDRPHCHTIRLEKGLSQTVVSGRDMLDQPAWHRPER